MCIRDSYYAIARGKLNQIVDTDPIIEEKVVTATTMEVEQPVSVKQREAKWFLLDDSTVSVFENETAAMNHFNSQHDTPYIMFYEKIKEGSEQASKQMKINHRLKKVIEQDNLNYMKELETSSKAIKNFAKLTTSASFFTDIFGRRGNREDEDGNNGPASQWGGNNQYISF
eukprot:TRINITY_DN27910_c0_g1_i1.p1 TRINITY_DN27910_c0_g1~~TRINITY_DN27910_c0_g1_i1.p1  ORF type:complete len:195 (-),score=56.21 TRINITY_DN27910_c0_g1_i1:199-711(-)